MSRPGLRWIKWRLVSCKHSHNDVGTRSSRAAKAMNKSPDATPSAVSPGATGRGGAVRNRAGCAARARKEDAARGWRGSSAESSGRRCRSVLGSPVMRAGGSIRSPDRSVYS